jgi:hypothetical protein
VEELQKWYAVETNSNKLILVNPNDLNIEVITTFTPEKSGSISHLFSKMSLAAPFLAAAKKEVIAFTELPDSGTNSGCSNNPTITANITQADRDAALAIQNLFVKIPKFLTIVASPRAIPDSKYSSCDNSAQRRVQVDLKYGSLDDDALHIGEILFNIDDSLLFLNVGRIYGITITDAFSNVMSSIYYNNLINKLYESNYNSMLSSQEVIGDCESMTDSLNVKMNNSGYNSICFTASTHPNCTRDLDPPLSDYYNKRIILHNGHGRYTDWYRTLDYSQIPWLDLSFCAVESCLTSNFWQGGKRTFALHWLRKGGIAYQGAPSIEFGYAGIAYSDICKDINSLRQLTGDDHLTITLGEGHKQMCLKKPYYRMSYILLGDPTLQPKFLEIN